MGEMCLHSQNHIWSFRSVPVWEMCLHNQNQGNDRTLKVKISIFSMSAQCPCDKYMINEMKVNIIRTEIITKVSTLSFPRKILQSEYIYFYSKKSVISSAIIDYTVVRVNPVFISVTRRSKYCRTKHKHVMKQSDDVNTIDRIPLIWQNSRIRRFAFEQTKLSQKWIWSKQAGWQQFFFRFPLESFTSLYSANLYYLAYHTKDTLPL